MTHLSKAKWFATKAPALIAFAAWMLIVSALDPAGDYPQQPQGPGLTVDEIFNVAQGVALVDHGLSGDWQGIQTELATLPDHPPLGRLWLGVFHEVSLIIHPPAGEFQMYVVACARTGSAAAFALLIWLIGTAVSRWENLLAGAVAALSLVLMPRLFGHAHLAALETILNLTWMAAVLSIAWKWTGPVAPGWKSAAICGLFFGLALLTKIQAVLLPVPVAVWAIWSWRQQAILPLFVWGITGFALFFVGWPWLWSDPVGHFWEYFAGTTERPTLYVWYFGKSIADRAIPWHYPWLLFLATVPIGLHLLGILGVISRDHSENDAQEDALVARQRQRLFLSCLLFPLILFSLPGVAVYDGTRLFLVIFPLWAIQIGRGAAFLWRRIEPRWGTPRASLAASLLLAGQAYGLFLYAPCYLSYYNVTVGGLAGANRLGLQPTYWGESVTRELLDEVARQLPEGTVVDFAPHFHAIQFPALLSQAPQLRKKNISFRPSQDPPQLFLLSFTRREYRPEDWRPDPPNAKVLAEVVRDGVRLAALYERAQSTSSGGRNRSAPGNPEERPRR